MDGKQHGNKNIRLHLKLEYPATPPGGRYFDTRHILKRKLEREPSKEELAISEYSMERKIQTMRIQAEKLCQEIVNEADTAIHVAVYLGGKGRVIGIPFIRFVRRKIAQIYQEQGIDICSADKLAADLLIDLLPYERALNISNEFFWEQRYDLFPMYHLYQDGEFLQDFVRNNPNEPFQRLKSVVVDQLSIIHMKAKHKDVHILLIDDESASGVTFRYAYVLVEEADRLCRNESYLIPHQTHVQTEWVHIAPYWQATIVNFRHDPFESQLNFRDLFCAYVGDSNILDIYDDEQLSHLMAAKPKGKKVTTIAGISLREFNHFISYVTHTPKVYIFRGGFAGTSNSHEIYAVQQPLLAHKLHLEEDFGLGTLVVEVDTAKAVEAFNRELGALFAQGFA